MSVDTHQAEPVRKLWTAVGNGIRCRCPDCGKGKLFRAYLKVVDRCSVCRSEMHHHRADDMPPYIAIFIVGHLLVGFMLHQGMVSGIHPAVYLAVMAGLAVLLPLLLLPSIKGGVVALQWANRMYGFDPAHRETSV